MEIPGHFRTNYKKIMKFQDIPGQKDKKKIQYHFSLKNKKAHIPGGSRKILDFGPSKLLEITFSALIFSTCRCTLDAILKFTCLKWLKMSSNSPPWLEKILKFTCLKWLKMSSNSPPWLEKILKFTCLKWLKMSSNRPPFSLTPPFLEQPPPNRSPPPFWATNAIPPLKCQFGNLRTPP